MEQIGAIRMYPGTQDEKQALNNLLARRYEQYLYIHGPVRRQILEYVLQFYALHVENFGEVRSLQVLKEVMS
jgi:DNA repair protein RecO (recombination protein O)